MPHLSSPYAPVSWGELLDKITILEIKRARIADPAALAHVEGELALLAALGADALRHPGTAALTAALKRVNETLWEVEDAIRAEERAGRFGEAFVALARQVYHRNDERAAIKRRINTLLGSALVEEKSYADYAAAPQPAAATGR